MQEKTSSICEYCLNFEADFQDIDPANFKKSKDTCKCACFKYDDNEGTMVCENFALVLCPDISSAVIERFLKKDIDFYDNLCEVTGLALGMFSYQTIFKIVFDVEHGSVSFFDLTNSQNTYGDYTLKKFELEKGFVHFETDPELKDIILSVVQPDSVVFVAFDDFEYQNPIKGIFMKPNRFYKKDRISLMMEVYNKFEVW